MLILTTNSKTCSTDGEEERMYVIGGKRRKKEPTR
jgi:hypothetical protein